MMAPCVTDAMVIRIMANYIREIDSGSSRMKMIADTLMLCAHRVEVAAQNHAVIQNDLDALVDLAGDKARVTEIAEAVLNRLPEWLTTKHGGPT